MSNHQMYYVSAKMFFADGDVRSIDWHARIVPGSEQSIIEDCLGAINKWPIFENKKGDVCKINIEIERWPSSALSPATHAS